MRQSKVGQQKGACEGSGMKSHRRWWCNGLRPSCTIIAASALLLPAATLCGRPPVASTSAPLEYEVKAAFLFRFAQFVEWPADTFKQASEPFTYCTMGQDPLREALERTLDGKTIGQRPLRVEHVNREGKIDECQVLFVGGVGDKKHVAETLAKTRTLPILTVGETDQFAENGGAIGFCTEDNKIRFEVNLDAAGKAGLKISAKLLALAKTVLGAPKGT